MISFLARSWVLIPAITFTVSLSTANAKELIIPKPPQAAAKAYILIDAKTGHVLVEENADEQLPPASLTKIMTSYIVEDELVNGKLSEQDSVYITDEAWRRGGTSSGGSTMFLKPRTEVAVIDLLRGVIIQSGNDASIALAQHVSGSEDAFADVMNQTAALLGMKSTHFDNATGWPADTHLTTARDLSLLAKATIYHHPKYYPLYAEKSFEYNGIKQDNRNSLLFRDSSVDGLKTGHTESAGFCLVSTAIKDGMRLIAVVLGTSSQEARAVESQKLLSYGFRYYETHNVVKGKQSVQTVRVWKGLHNELALGVLDDLELTIARGSSDALEVVTEVYSKIKAPIVTGQSLGKISVSYSGDVLYSGDLVALNDVAEAGFFARLWDSLVLFIDGLLA